MKKWFIVLGLFIAAVVATMFYVTRTPRGVDADLEAIRRMGFATTDAEARAKQPTEGANAAEDYFAVGSLLYNSGKEGKAFKRVEAASPMNATTATTNATALHAVSNDIKFLQPLIDRCAVATQKPRCVFNKDIGAIADGKKYSDDAVTSAIFDLLTCAAVYQATEGHPKEAMELMSAIARLSSQLAKDEQTRMAFDGREFLTTGFFTWMRLLPYCKNDHEAIRAAVDALNAMPSKLPSLRSDAVYGFTMTRSTYDLASADPEIYFKRLGRKVSSVNSSKVVGQRATAQAIHEWRVFFETLPDDPFQWMKATNIVREGNQAFKTQWPMNAYFFVPFGDVEPRGHASAHSTLRMSRLSSLLLQGWLDGKPFPADLSGFGELAHDPLYGKDFDYQKVGHGFVLYVHDIAGPGTASSSATIDEVKSGKQFVVKFNG